MAKKLISKPETIPATDQEVITENAPEIAPIYAAEVNKSILEQVLNSDEVETMRNRAILNEIYFGTFGFYHVPLTGSPDILRECIQNLKNHYSIK